MAEIGTKVQESNYSNFDFLDNINLKKSQLNIKVEIGVLNIPSREGFQQAFVENFAENQFFPTPGGKQGQSFAANPILNPNKSQTLSATVNGIANQHFEVTGAPYCTFVEGTLEAGQPHPYYNLIVGPAGAPSYEASSTLSYAENNPAILTQFFQQSYNAESLVFNKVGKPFVPGTTKTSNAVAEKQKSGAIKAITSYNIWEVENLGGIDPRDPKQVENKTNFFNFQRWLGFLPKPGATLEKTQPYAQTVSFSDTSEIQVFASNSQVSLRRYYPISKDYAHSSDCKYLIYDSATGSEPELKAEPLKLYNEYYSPNPKKPNIKEKVPGVGFVLKFSSVVLNNIPPTAASGSPTVLAAPQILVSWGKISATEEELKQATAAGQICKYTLKLSANDTPTVYFNITDRELTNDVVSPNNKSVALTSLKGLNYQDGNTGSKSPNNLQIFVYYSGPYMQIGNSTNPGEWQTIAAFEGPVDNPSNSPEQPLKKLRHKLDEESEIRISAQFVNFTFSYGPPLFSPYDPNNINKFSANLANTLNFVSGSIPKPIQPTQSKPSVFNGFADQFLSQQTSVPENILSNAIVTFASAEDFDVNVKDDDINDETTEINSPAYIDARAVILASDFSYDTTAQGTKFKLTFPKNAGGFTFNNFKPTYAPEPNIKEFYSYYDFKLKNAADSITEILSGAVKSLSVTKKIDSEKNSRIESDLNIQFINLNKSEAGLTILQFMRQNITTIRVSAGYETLYPFFEGMVEEITVTEGLSETNIKVSSKDLLQKLFIDDETIIVSTVYMKFQGMRYNKAINQMVYYSELHNHFKYALGDPTKGGEQSQTLGYAFNFNKDYRLPRLDASQLNTQAARFQISPYDDKVNTYFNMLASIKNLAIQINDGRSQNHVRFDVPIYYWYTSGSSEDKDFQGTKEVVKGNGVVMSSRTLGKDTDIFYLSKKDISKEMTTNISSLHGMLFSNDAFTSTSKSTNLFREGRYRYMDAAQRFHNIKVINKKEISFEALKNNGNYIDSVESYIGYPKLIMFDKAPQEFNEVQMSNTLIPKNEYASSWVKRIFNSAFSDVYENIKLKVFVAKPLKEWGSFYVAFEEGKKLFTLEQSSGRLIELPYDQKSGNSIDTAGENRMPDRYLYQSVTYNFDLEKNLITAEIDASKKAIQALE
jgi:hypothetical protein